MPDLLKQEDERSSSEDEDEEAHEEQLSELLESLRADPGNPDLWMEAATTYVALGRRRRASRAYRASVEAVRREEEALVKIYRLLHGEDVPSVGFREEVGPEGPGGQESFGEVDPETLGPSGSQLDMVGVVSAFANEREALEQLRRELSPQQAVTCPRCNTLLEVAESWCPGCGKEMKERGATLQERVGQAQSALEGNKDDAHALFTVAAQLAVSGRHEEALEHLIRLTAVAPRYPGLWWVKARVFLDVGKPEAAQASFRMAQQIMAETGYGKTV